MRAHATGSTSALLLDKRRFLPFIQIGVRIG